MNTLTRLAALPLTLAALNVPGFGQPFQGILVQPSQAQGLFSNTAAGISVKGISPADPLLIRSPGTNGGVPTEWTASAFSPASQDHPDYSMAALTHWAPSGITVPIFGGISTGGEIMPAVDGNGALQMTAGNWFMLAITVDATSKGKPGSLLRQRTANGTASAAGDILSYYTIGSSGINTSLVNTVRLESSKLQLKLQQALPITGGVREIANFDYGMGVISEDEANQAGDQFPARDSFYFTLTRAWVDAAAIVAPELELDGEDPSASTVYGMTWDATQMPPWSEPFIVFDHATLFPPLDFPNATPGTVEIDALSVDRGVPPLSPATAPKRVVFSLTRASNEFAAPAVTFNQILVHQSSPLVTTRPLMTDPLYPVSQPLSQTFTTKIGLRDVADHEGQPDDVTSTCGGDPKESHTIGPVFALATNQNRAGAGELGTSCMRTTGGTDGNDTLHLQITGLDHSGHAFGFIQLFTEGGVGTPPKAPEPWGDPIWINSTMAASNSMDLAIPVPSVQVGIDFRFSAHLIGLNFTPGPTSTFLRESWVLSIAI